MFHNAISAVAQCPNNWGVGSVFPTLENTYFNHVYHATCQGLSSFICPIPAGAQDRLHSNPVPLPRPPADPPVERQGFSPHVAW